MNSEKCKNVAIRYVARGIKTEGQVQDYLRRKEFGQEEIDYALEFLREYQYVDDARYCRSYYREACQKGRSRRRIEQELANKKMDRNTIREALDQFLSEENPDYEEVMEEILPEKERAMKVARKMTESQLDMGKDIDRNFLAKVGRRLMSLGYGADVIYGIIGILMRESERSHD